MKKVWTLIVSLLMFFVYWPAQLIPKKKGLWIFGAWYGEKYGDNTKYLFEYINKNEPHIRAIWLTKNQQALTLVQNKGFEANWMYSLKGFYYSARAEKLFITVGVKDINRFVINRKNLILMWHGNTPIKKIVFDDKITRKNQSVIEKLIFSIFPFLGMTQFNGVTISGSDDASKIFKSALKTSDDRILLTGFPRNDSFFSSNQNSFLCEELDKLKKLNMTSVIYMPTHRKEGKGNIDELLQNDIIELNSLFKSIQSTLFIKLHYFHLEQLNFKNLSNIYFIRDEDIDQDIYTVLSNFDILITDFSSVHFDFLHTRGPIIFAPFDKKNYLQDDREFYFDYSEVTPGPHANNWNEIIEYIQTFTENPNYYETERKQVHNRFNYFRDGNNSHRVFNAVKNLN